MGDMSEGGISGVVAAVALIIGVSKAGFFWTLMAMLGAFALNLIGFFTKPRIRPLIKERYWGRGGRRPDDQAVKEFQIKVGAAYLWSERPLCAWLTGGHPSFGSQLKI